jgi:predicted DCC family thiol-disulfide oxidoreductase YuxK
MVKGEEGWSVWERMESISLWTWGATAVTLSLAFIVLRQQRRGHSTSRFIAHVPSSTLPPYPAPLIVVDGDCILCNATARWIYRRNQQWSAGASPTTNPRKPKMYFATLQSDVGERILSNVPQLKGVDSVLLVERLRSEVDERHHAGRSSGFASEGSNDGDLVKVQIRTKSAAAFAILKGLDGTLESAAGSVLSLCIPIAVGDFFYSMVARNRYRLFGKSEGIVCRRVPKKKPQTAAGDSSAPSSTGPPTDSFEGRIWNTM